jgi:hypothetical protein
MNERKRESIPMTMRILGQTLGGCRGAQGAGKD